jgi:hypothetical protein
MEGLDGVYDKNIAAMIRRFYCTTDKDKAVGELAYYWVEDGCRYEEAYKVGSSRIVEHNDKQGVFDYEMTDREIKAQEVRHFVDICCSGNMDLSIDKLISVRINSCHLDKSDVGKITGYTNNIEFGEMLGRLFNALNYSSIAYYAAKCNNQNLVSYCLQKGASMKYVFMGAVFGENIELMSRVSDRVGRFAKESALYQHHSFVEKHRSTGARFSDKMALWFYHYYENSNSSRWCCKRHFYQGKVAMETIESFIST